MNYRIESLMSARLFVAPQYAFDRVYFMSNLSGHLSLYAMYHGGSVPEPLLPPWRAAPCAIQPAAPGTGRHKAALSSSCSTACAGGIASMRVQFWCGCWQHVVG